MEFAYLARRAFDDDVAQCDLAVATDGDLRPVRRRAPHADDGGAVKLFHVLLEVRVLRMNATLR